MEPSVVIAINAVERAIPYLKLPAYKELNSDTCFVHTSLYKATHQVFEEPDPTKVKDYERLEFLGDAVLQFGVSDMLTTLYPGLTEGGCTTLRQSLVKNETLALLSVALGLPSRLQAAPSDLSRLRQNRNVSAAIFESYLGAIRREYGLTSARVWLDEIYRPLAIAAYEAVSISHRLAEVQKVMREGDLTPPRGPEGVRDPLELIRMRQEGEVLLGSKMEILPEPIALLNLKRARLNSIPSPTPSTTILDITMEDVSSPSPSTATSISDCTERILLYTGAEEGHLVGSFVSYMEEWSRARDREVNWRQGNKTGPDHEPTFVYGITFHDPSFGTKEAMGTGKTWKKAKNNAAHAACDVIGIAYI